MSEIKRDIDFRNLYKEMKELYPDIVELTDSEIENIKNQSDKESLEYKTSIYLAFIIAAMFFFDALAFLCSQTIFVVVFCNKLFR